MNVKQETVEYRGYQITEAVRAEFAEDEGFRNEAYLDQTGAVHVGVGHNASDRPVAGKTYATVDMFQLAYPEGLSDDKVWELFEDDLVVAIDDAIAFTGGEEAFGDLPTTAQNVIVQMSFNMGLPRLRQFKKFQLAVKKGDFWQAAEEMMDSRWYRQVGKRAERLVDQMRNCLEFGA